MDAFVSQPTMSNCQNIEVEGALRLVLLQLDRDSILSALAPWDNAMCQSNRATWGAIWFPSPFSHCMRPTVTTWPLTRQHWQVQPTHEDGSALVGPSALGMQAILLTGFALGAASRLATQSGKACGLWTR